MNNNQKKRLWIGKEVLCAVIVPVVFLILAWVLKMLYLQENSYPVDYEILDSYMWADSFFYVYMWSAAICVLYHVLIALIGAKTKFNTQVSWLIYGIIAVCIALFFARHFSINFPEESNCGWIAMAFFFLEYVVTFFVSTYCCPKHWDFFPFK